MSLLPATKAIIDIAERVSGYPVVVTEDASLQTLAAMQMASNAAPMHIVKFRPVPGEAPDYFISYQCGFIVRLFETPPELRFRFAIPNETITKRGAELFGRAGLADSSEQFVRWMIEGVLTQLRSFPIGLRIDDWLLNVSPGLRLQQVKGARLQLAQNASALNLPLRNRIPEKIINANTAMNAAFAIYWAKSLVDDSVTLPYKAIGALKPGQELMDIFATIDPSPSNDTSLVDQWASDLGFEDWYRWAEYVLD